MAFSAEAKMKLWVAETDWRSSTPLLARVASSHCCTSAVRSKEYHLLMLLVVSALSAVARRSLAMSLQPGKAQGLAVCARFQVAWPMLTLRSTACAAMRMFEPPQPMA